MYNLVSHKCHISPCTPNVNAFFKLNPLHSVFTTPGTYRFFGFHKEMILQEQDRIQNIQERLLMDTQRNTPYCNPYRLATIIGELFNKHYTNGELISQIDLYQIQSSILKGSYKFSLLKRSHENLLNRETPLPWYNRAYLVGKYYYKNVMVAPKDLLVIRALGQMLYNFLHHSVSEDSIDVLHLFEEHSLYKDQIDIKYDYDPSYHFYYNITELPGYSTNMNTLLKENGGIFPEVSDSDNEYRSLRVSHLYYMDLSQSLYTLKKEKIISNLTPYVRDPKIIRLINQFLNMKYTTDKGKSISMLEYKSLVIPPVGCLLTDSLFEFALLGFDSRLSKEFYPPYSIFRNRNEIFLVRPSEIHISELVNENYLTNEIDFNSIVQKLLEEFHLNAHITQIESGSKQLVLPMVHQDHLLFAKPEFGMLISPDGYILGDKYLYTKNENCL